MPVKAKGTPVTEKDHTRMKPQNNKFLPQSCLNTV